MAAGLGSHPGWYISNPPSEVLPLSGILPHVSLKYLLYSVCVHMSLFFFSISHGFGVALGPAIIHLAPQAIKLTVAF